MLALVGSLLTAVSAAPGRELTDATGRRVTVPDEPRRMASLCTSATDTLLRLGLGDRLVAIDEYSRVVPGAEALPVMGKGSAISREQVIATGVDMAFIWWYQDEAAALFEDLGVPVVRLRAARIHEIPELVRLIGTTTGAGAPAEELARNLTDSLARLREEVPAAPAAHVYVELYGALKTAGRDSYLNDLLVLAGASNIAAEAEGSLLLSRERLLEANPDTIFFVRDFARAEDFAQRPGWSGLAAVRKGRIIPVDRYLLVAGAGWAEAVSELRQRLYTKYPSED
jgi:iron complex transport system substrate-binding protein